jgi:broad specificity phosphatase PhoE
MPIITLVRHGQASFGKANYDQLSEIGFAQARQLGTALREREESLDAVFIGGMLRHRQTAETCLEAMGMNLPLQELPNFSEFNHENILERFEPRYRDRDWLAAEAVKHQKPLEVFLRLFQAAIKRWIEGLHDDDYEETWLQFQRRVQNGLDRITLMADQKHALVFTSGGCISVVAKTLLDLNDTATFRTNWTLANCGLTRMAQGTHQRHLMSLNEFGHFSGLHQQLLTYR